MEKQELRKKIRGSKLGWMAYIALLCAGSIYFLFQGEIAGALFVPFAGIWLAYRFTAGKDLFWWMT